LIQPGETPGSWSPFLRRAFLLIIVGIFVAGIVSLYVILHTQREVQGIETQSVGSITLVFRLSRDIEMRRRLVDAHIVEIRLADMDRIEAQLGGVNARIAAISRDYEPTINDDAERKVWQRLQAEVEAVQPAAEKILVLSRKNLDSQARNEMNALEPQFDVIDRTMDDGRRSRNSVACFASKLPPE
jgi:uncharacterized membrane protein YgaE (UPF0421/DUF939 family)